MPSFFGRHFSPRGLVELPGIRQLSDSFLFRSLKGRDLGHFRGRFASRQEAAASLPPAATSEYDDEQLVDVNVEEFSRIHPFDWPVIALLQRFMREGRLRVLTDFGGHVGVKYRAYRPMLDASCKLIWQVVDVPAMVREGRRRLAPGESGLRFFEQPEETEPCDALLLSGVVQYLPFSIDEIVERLPRKPYLIFLNKVVVAGEGAGYFTIEHYIKPLPYRIYGSGELEETAKRMGYHRIAQWPLANRELLVIDGVRLHQAHAVGEAWCLEPEV